MSSPVHARIKSNYLDKLMRTYSLWRNSLAVLAASLFLANAPLTSAQEAGQGRRGGGGAAFQNMTDEQREALQQVNQEIRNQAQAVRQARIDLNGAIYAAKVDEAAIKAKVAALAKSEEEQAIAYAKAFAKVRSKFTSEQIEALKNAPGRGGFGGGRGGGRRGGNN